MPQVTAYKVDTLVGVKPDSIIALKVPNENKFELYVSNRQGVPFPLKLSSTSGGINSIVNTDGNLNISGTSTITINISNALLNTINSALQAGDNISNLLNDAGYLVSADLPTRTSQLINDGSDNTSTYVETDELGTTAFSNSYNDLDDIPSPIDITGKVPYIGATTDVDLGEFQLKAGQLEFDQTPTGTFSTGKMRWNDIDGTAEVMLKGGNVTLQLGQEQLVRVVNKTLSDLLESNYQAVYISGAQGQRLKVDLAIANSEITSAGTLGIVTENISVNQEGFVTTNGIVRNINTTGTLQGETWIDGDILYLSPTVYGGITNVAPSAPNHTVVIGVCIHAHNTQGSIFVKVNNGYRLEELHNVLVTTPLNNQVISYEDATDLWKNKNITDVLGYTPENVANKQNSLAVDGTGVKYATIDAVNAGLTSLTLNVVLRTGNQTINGVKTFFDSPYFASGQFKIFDGDLSLDGAVGLSDAVMYFNTSPYVRAFEFGKDLGLNIYNSVGVKTNLKANLATTKRTQTFPDKDGTFAMTSDIITATEITEVTYSQLLALKNGSLLKKGKTYLLTDYMTTYEQPVTNATKSSGVVEQLYVTATDVNKLSNECLSKLHPEDIVFYEITGDIGNGYGVEGFTKGKIYRRIDTIRNNDIGTDWRYVKYDRAGVDKLLFEDYTGCFNNTIKTYYLFNNVMGGYFYSNNFGNDCYSNTFGNNCNWNNFKDYFHSNTIGTSFYSNSGEYFFNSNAISSNCRENYFRENFTNNTIGLNFANNTIGLNFANNTFGSNIKSYTFSEVSNKNFTGLLTTTNVEKKVYKQQNGNIILSSVDNFGDTILEIL